MFNIKKAISPVVSVSLLLIVAVVAVIGFQSWFSNFSSSVFTDVESQSSSSITVNKGIETLIGSDLYFNLGDNTIVQKIEINDINCNFSGNFSGLSKLDISSCLQKLPKDTTKIDIVILSDNKLYETTKIITLDSYFSTCLEIKNSNNSLQSGFYNLKYQNTNFLAYCDMDTQGGGWTLLVNINDCGLGCGLARNQNITPTKYNVFTQNGYSLAYDKIKLGKDLIIDYDNTDIINNSHDGRVMFSDIHNSSVNKTLKDIWTGKYGTTYFEREDNSNIIFIKNGTNPETNYYEFSTRLNNSYVLNFYDTNSYGAGNQFLIGSSVSYSSPHANAAGFPEHTNTYYIPPNSRNYWPKNIRIWTR